MAIYSLIIFQVLNEIQKVSGGLLGIMFAYLEGNTKVIVENLSNKFNGVKRDVRMGRDRILREAAFDLEVLRKSGSVYDI